MKRFICHTALILAFLLLFPPLLAAQVTKVRGQVVDADTGEPVPFAGVYFDGTTIGISTDLDGRYSIETRAPEAKRLTAHLLGYAPQSVDVQPGAFSEINFRLKPERNDLTASVVKPDNRRLKRFLDELDRRRKQHDPANYPAWSSRLYSKIEMDATHAESLISNSFLQNTFAPILSFRDTSSVTGETYIPIMISETVSDQYHSLDPSVDREVIRANRISGIDPDNLLTQFTGVYLFKPDFYKNNLSLFSLQIPSPASSYGHAFYNYFLVDSLMVDGRKTYTLRFHPKKAVTSPALDGQLDIDAEDYAIRSAHVRLAGSSNVNWIRHINIEVVNRRLPSGKWFPQDENVFIDFSMALDDSAKVISFLGNRNIRYEEPDWDPVLPPETLKSGDPVLLRHRADTDWNQLRPYPLSPREEGIFTAVDMIQQTPGYKAMYAIARTMAVGYVEPVGKPVGFGPWIRTVSYNGTEGLHLGLGFRTTKDFSEKVRLRGSLGYGFKDRKVKWNAGAEWILRRDKTRKLSIYAGMDDEQLGRGSGIFARNNIFSSLASSHGNDRHSFLREYKLSYEHEFSPSFTSWFIAESRRIFANDLVPLHLRDGGDLVSVSANQLHYTARLSWQEKINRGVFDKSFIYTRYPIIEWNWVTGLSGITDDDFRFNRTELSIDWSLSAGPLGFGFLHADGGIIWGEVPYPLLKLHEGNEGFILDKSCFACMNYFEFASDRWATLSYEHNFNGLILGVLPLVGRWDWREVVSVKSVFGTLTPQNGSESRYLPIEGLSSLDGAPYVEASAGISNIFRIFRVDANWRLTHRDRNPFRVTMGVDIQF